MQTHKIGYCCEAMSGYINSGLITVNTDTNMASMVVVNIPTPDDDELQDPEITRIPINYCPNCSDKIIIYSENVPPATYTRAELTGASCNDVTCRFLARSSNTCGYQYRTNGRCFSTSAEEKQAYSDLRENVQTGWQEMVEQ